jgi:membrane-associated phospholipid phosphatase
MTSIPHKIIYKNYSLKRLIIAVALGLVGALLFASIYDGIREHGDLARLDNPTLMWVIAHRSSGLTSLMKLVTTIFSPVGLGSIVTLFSVGWAWRSKEIWRPVLLMGSMGLAFSFSTIIKHLTERTRPPHMDMIKPLELDYSFPSGHTLGISVCFLVAGYLIFSRRHLLYRHIAAWAALSLATVILVAFSRLYLGYHWLTDVSASVGVAFVVLAIIILIDPLEPTQITRKVFSNTDR